MTIAYTMAQGRGDIDLLLAGLATRLAGQGARLCGVVQINSACDRPGPCDMDVMVLPDGEIIRISQSLGPGARGCRLNPEALETAVALVETGLAQGADLLVINKFGKHESEGRGFRTVIADAMLRGIPVLVGLNPTNLPAFRDFTQGLANEVAPDLDALAGWFREQARADSDAA